MFPSIYPRKLTTDEQKQRELFLLLLDKDLPRTTYCYYCQKLHVPDKTAQVGYPLISGILCTRASGCKDYCHKDFQFSGIQMPMKLHHAGMGP